MAIGRCHAAAVIGRHRKGNWNEWVRRTPRPRPWRYGPNDSGLRSGRSNICRLGVRPEVAFPVLGTRLDGLSRLTQRPCRSGYLKTWNG